MRRFVRVWGEIRIVEFCGAMVGVQCLLSEPLRHGFGVNGRNGAERDRDKELIP